MKRSEALMMIANQLDFLNGKFKGVRTNLTKKELSNADVILTTLEELGMLPPDVSIKRSFYEPKIVVNEWESENEKK